MMQFSCMKAVYEYTPHVHSTKNLLISTWHQNIVNSICGSSMVKWLTVAL